MLLRQGLDPLAHLIALGLLIEPGEHEGGFEAAPAMPIALPIAPRVIHADSSDSLTIVSDLR